MNNIEPSINLTNEQESNNSIPFLDILIIKSPNNLTRNICRKPTKRIIYIFTHHYCKIRTALRAQYVAHNN